MSALQEDVCTARPTVHIEHRIYFEQVKRLWPDKDRVRNYLVDQADTLSRDWPPMSRQALFRFTARFGADIANHERLQDCMDAWIALLKRLAVPEPGYEGVTLEVEYCKNDATRPK